ncbi:MAG: leucine--tRNA ligase [Deltaproteobacteria bacterium]|nr:MAG: leucine--tRNA ligase [Deltaproteobacteria bacterium]
MNFKYSPHNIEEKWQKRWKDSNAFYVHPNINKSKKKYYILDMFPYPSGAGLHVGHLAGYTATDVIARLKRVLGFNVLHPMGWDAFGLPTERAAARENTHPETISTRNIINFKNQIEKLGYSYDWSREINTSNEKYYRWTQWIFSKLYQRGLAYLANTTVNWCPALGTVLANEEVSNNKYIETGDIVVQKKMTQWMLKITNYAERLLNDLDYLDWPENIKDMQRNWIGKTNIISFKCKVKSSNLHLEIFSDSIHTIYNDSFISIAYDHPIIPLLLKDDPNKNNILSFCHSIQTDEIVGVFSNYYIEDPFSNSNLPIWISNLNPFSYGTGILRCSSHKDLDFQFAKKYKIPLKHSFIPIFDNELRLNMSLLHLSFKDISNGFLINSGKYNGKNPLELSKSLIKILLKKQITSHQILFKLKDWLFSRQRYWGEPFPIIYNNEKTPELVPEKDLPVKLPFIASYLPSPNTIAPLEKASPSWRFYPLPNGKIATREINTMPQWAGSCWYYLRFIDPNNDNELCDKKLSNYWLPVDLYVGGIEHAVLHLLYARFWHKVLFDIGIVNTKEPFLKLFNQGMILSRSFQDTFGKYLFVSEVYQKKDLFIKKSNNEVVVSQIEKMSKSRLNVINPDELIAQYGADSLRLYELFMGPLDQVKIWQTNGIEGMFRFLTKVWFLSRQTLSNNKKDNPYDIPLWNEYYQILNLVLNLSLDLKFNVAISKMMIFLNTLLKHKFPIPKKIFLGFLQMLAPYAPHICEEIWEILGQKKFISKTPWPSFKKYKNIKNHACLSLHLNGKKIVDIDVNQDLQPNIIKKKIAHFLLNYQKKTSPKKIIVIPNKIINIIS